MKKIDFEDQTYYLNKGVLYDSSFIEVPKNISEKILPTYYQEIDYKNFDEEALISYIKDTKTCLLYQRCLEASTWGLTKFYNSFDFYKFVFPVITSCHRYMGNPQKAISFWETNKHFYPTCSSVPLLTSLAAAYCDINDYVSAKKYANRAYAIQGGTKNYQTELSLVYQRIKKDTNDY